MKKPIDLVREDMEDGVDRYVCVGTCATCGTEYPIAESMRFGPHRIERKLGDFIIEVTTGQRSWNGHDLCPECVIGVLNTGRWRSRSILYMGNPPYCQEYFFIHPFEYTKRLLSGEIKLYHHSWDNTTTGSFK